MIPQESIAHYRIVSKLGQGGMGVVYRALDTKLDRDVAIKVLPDDVARDPERLARLEREAKLLASLNHPNIATIYGIEDRALVMELVEGPTLAERLRGGALPLEEAVRVAAQIAEGLESAHDRGVVHRDLKPANVKFTPDGNVKILDFGLAKAMETSRVASLEPENSPTLTCASTPGMILGTAAYMAPEQASGRPVDRRADIWAFGVVLWEMLAGSRLFAAESISATLTKVLTGEVDLERLPADTPPGVRELLRRCLDRDEKTRLRDIGEARYVLRRPLVRKEATPVPAPAPPPRGRRTWLGLTAASIPLALLSLIVYRLATAPDPAEAHRFVPFATEAYGESNPVWAPDGRTIAFTASIDGVNHIFTRAVESGGTARVIACPALCEPIGWSADGARIFYKSRTDHLNARIWSVGSSGGDPVRIFGEGVKVMAAAVSPDGKRLAILMDENDNNKVLLFLSDPIGSPPVRIEGPPASPRVQPTYVAWSTDSDHILLKLNGPGRIFVGSASSRSVRPVEWKLKPLFTSGMTWPHARYAIAAITPRTNLHGLFWVDTVSGDSSPLRIVELPVSLPAASPDGSRLAYTAAQTDFDLMEIPLNGSPVRPLLASRLPELSVAVSPLNEEYAYVLGRPKMEIRIRQNNGLSERVIVTEKDFPPGTDGQFAAPTFSPDGLRIAYLKGFKVWISSTNGGQAVPMDSLPNGEFSPAWSPDGKWIAFICNRPSSSCVGLYKIRVGASSAIKLNPLRCDSAPEWSPDGKWISCGVDEKGLHLIPSEGGDARPLGQQFEITAAWSKESNHMYVIRNSGGMRELGSLDWRTGAFQKLNDIPRDFVISSGTSWTARMALTRDGRSLLTAVQRQTGDIWILDGLRAPQPFWKRILSGGSNN